MTAPLEMIDAYRAWRAAIKGIRLDGHAIVTGNGDGVGDPQPGMWRMRDGSRTAPFVPVKIWLVDDETGQPVHKVHKGMKFRCAAQRGKDDRVLTHEETIAVWAWCMTHPVTIEDRNAWLKDGRWPGEVDAPVKPTLAEQNTTAAPAAAPREPTIGDNSKGTEADPFLAIKAEFDDYAATCAAFLDSITKAGGIKTKVEADQANNMADCIGKVRGGIAKRADEKREELVAPHLEAQREINGRFKPIIENGDAIAKTLRGVATIWTVAEQNRLQAIAAAEAKKKADAENARRAEELKKFQAEQAALRRAEAERQAAMAAQLGEPVAAPELDDEPEPIVIPDDLKPVEVIVPQVKLQVGGQRGAKRSLKTRKVATVTDYAKALAFFAETDDVKELIATLAQRAVTAGVPVPGVEVSEAAAL